MKQAKPFFETGCHKCGIMDEAKFVFSTNGAVKQICNNCRAYIKFFDKSLVPTVHDIKKKIWYITEADIQSINEAKKAVEFVEGLTKLNAQLMYWDLYLHIRKLCCENINQNS